MSNARPAGWYYAEGDPPGTQRYWDGQSWQGGPQAASSSGDLSGGSIMGGGDGDYKGFLPSLFDFELTSYITPKIIKIFYIISVVLICLAGLGFLILSLTNGVGGFIVGLIFVPLFTIFYLIIARMSVESTIVTFRTFDEVKKLSGGR